jgi:hypothetical protein
VVEFMMIKLTIDTLDETRIFFRTQMKKGAEIRSEGK